MNQRDFRMLHGMTLAGFGKLIGVHEQTVWRYENGRVPSPKVMRLIQKEFPQIDISTYYAKDKIGIRSIGAIVVAFSIIISAFPAYGGLADSIPVSASQASYEELIFCSRWYEGVHAALQTAGEGDSAGAKAALIEGRMFGYRAIAATPQSELSNALKVIAASNEAVNQILSKGTEADWRRIDLVCGSLK